MVLFVVGYVVDEDHHDAVVVLIENGIGDHDAVARLNAHVAIRMDLHGVTSQVTSNDFRP